MTAASFLRCASGHVRRLGLTWRIAAGACLLAVVYWGVIASDRYISEARVVVQRSDAGNPAAADFTALLVGNAAPQDLLLMRDYLLSADMLRLLDARLHLRAHYADSHRDPLSRLWPADASLERFHAYYQRHVSIEIDDVSHVLVIQAEAYTPEMARAIGGALVEEGERFMNAMTHRIASEQVDYIAQQVRQQGERLAAARQAVLAWQNAHGVVSPRAEVKNLTEAVAAAEARLAELNVKRNALRDVFTPEAAAIRELDLQIEALGRQIARERARMVSASSKPGLNRAVEEQERLQAAAEFAFDLYRTALAALEKARVEATRKLKNVSVVQQPTLPEYPLAPRRFYNIVVFVLATAMLAGVARLLGAIIRDHRD